jgi:hypothetical protein
MMKNYSTHNCGDYAAPFWLGATHHNSATNKGVRAALRFMGAYSVQGRVQAKRHIKGYN